MPPWDRPTTGPSSRRSDPAALDSDSRLRAMPPARRERSVALTGAASFLGRHLIGVLEEDPHIERIVAIDVRPPENAGKKTRFYEIDLTAPASGDRVAEVLAA